MKNMRTLVSDFILANQTFWRPQTLRSWSYQTWRNRHLCQRVPRACLDLPEYMMWERAEAIFRTLTFRFPAKNPSRSILQELRQRRANDPVALIYLRTFRLKGCVLWIFVACYIFNATNLFQSFQFIDLNSFFFCSKNCTWPWSQRNKSNFWEKKSLKVHHVMQIWIG